MDAQTLVEQTRSRLLSVKGKYAELARLNPGLPYDWLTKFAQGTADNPTTARLQAVIEALDAFEVPPVATEPVSAE